MSSEAEQFFVDSFRVLLGYAPMRWQTRLFTEHFLRGAPPRAVSVPTGLGKTATIAIWLIAMAWHLRTGRKPLLPRRLIYVVDRRAVVDQATDYAERIRAALQTSEFEALRRSLAISGSESLAISTLRGQFVDNREWLEDPTRLAIIVGTVDMIGSRLLFEGYNVSRRMRPYHAGLLGTDSLIVLDEAHLVPPFERLIDQIASGFDANGQSLRPRADLDRIVPPLRAMFLSATLSSHSEEEVFSLTEKDFHDPVVSERVLARKGIRFSSDVAVNELPEALAREAWSLTENGTVPHRVLVYCHSRQKALQAREALTKLAGKSAPIDIELVVGARRIFERQQVARWLADHGFIGESCAPLSRPAFVIATAAGEVGIDINADHAVCDLVAWERMVQRLGRVNRRGKGDATVVIVPAEAHNEAEKARLEAVRELLALLPARDDGMTDGSIAQLRKLMTDPRARALAEKASTPPTLHPPLVRPLVEAWAMTSVEEHTGRPEVEPWIRGWHEDRNKPQTTVVWRKFLPLTDDGELFAKDDLALFLDTADPHLSERLETDTFEVVDWLAKRMKRLERPPGEMTEPAAGLPPLCRGEIVAVIVKRGCSPEAIRVETLSGDRRHYVAEALKNAVLIVDHRLGGLADGLLDDTSNEPVLDVTEWEPEGMARLVPFRLRRVDVPQEPTPAEGWRMEASIPLRTTEEGESAWLVIESLTGQLAASEEGRSVSRRLQELDEHEEWTESTARRIATALNLEDDFAQVLLAAARLHDEGKRAERWQRAFFAPRTGKAYAKTPNRPSHAILGGYRHEFGSLSYAERHPRIQALSEELRRLCLHLISAHHGFGRPLIRYVGDGDAPSRLARRAQEVVLRFSELQKAWGPWGLAWWEALLRAADQDASRRNDLQRHGGMANG